MTPPQIIIPLLRAIRQSVFLMGIMPVCAVAAPSYLFHARVGTPVPNVNLPPSITAADNTLTLHADFAKASEGTVPLYLVNRTAEGVVFTTQDHDIYMKLERKMPNGRWERVQFHQYSFCANSYYPVELATGHHFVFSGYLPTRGTKAQVRFRSYGPIPLVSNEGEGFFLEEDRIAAGFDQMALRELPKSINYYFKYEPNQFHRIEDKVADEKFLSVLRIVSSYRESRYVRGKAEAFLASIKETDDYALKLAAAIKDILSREWPAEAATESLLKTALAELPEHPIPAWYVINEIMRKEIAPNIGVGSPFGTQVVEEVEKALLRDNATEIEAIAQLIGSPRFAGEHFDDAFFEKWIRSHHEVLVQECANTLSLRLKFDTLAKIGLELKPSAQLIILRSLASSGLSESGTRSSRDSDTEIERSFWIKCASEQPIQTAFILSDIGKDEKYNRFSLTMHKPLREFLIREASAPSKEINGWDIVKVAAFVGTWKRREDIAVFRSLLTHPFFHLSEGTISTRPGVRLEFRQYRVRQEARRILIELGESIPADIVFEKEREIP